MSRHTSTHPSRDDLILYCQGRLDRDRLAVIEEHISSCNCCCELLRTLPDDTLVNHLRQSDTETNYWSPINEEVLPQVAEALPAELQDHPRYRVMKRVGSGGMGVVFKAEHRFMERLVALKVMNQRLIRNQVALERFRQEVKAAARLSHPNIVTAYDAEQVGALQVLVMEYVDGISIARQVEKAGPMPIRFACQFARQAALGLQHAHEKGMIHRDIKPHNLMLTRDAQVKILDFGLARYSREANPPDSTPTGGSELRSDQRLTQVGKALGTPDYMAPEQVQSAATVDIRADIYSLGCTLYFMIAGHPPFPGGTLAEKLSSQLERDPVELTVLRPEVPVALQDVIKRMTAKNPADRFSTPGELVEALTPFTKANTPVLPVAVALPTAELGQSVPEADLKERTEKPAPRRVKFAKSISRPRSPRVWRKIKRYAAPLLIMTGLVALAIVAWIIFSPASLIPSLTKNPSTAKQSAVVEGSKSLSNVPGTTPRVARILMVVPHDDFWPPDVANLRRAAQSTGAIITIASSQRTPARASRQGPSRETVSVDMLLSEAQATDYDSIIFTGANPSESLEHLQDKSHEQVTRNLIQQFLAQSKPIAAICMGSRVLADLGFLKGRTAARCPYQPKDEAYSKKASWTGNQVQIDGPFITGKDQDAAKLLMQKILMTIR